MRGATTNRILGPTLWPSRPSYIFKRCRRAVGRVAERLVLASDKPVSDRSLTRCCRSAYVRNCLNIERLLQSAFEVLLIGHFFSIALDTVRFIAQIQHDVRLAWSALHQAFSPPEHAFRLSG